MQYHCVSVLNKEQLKLVKDTWKILVLTPSELAETFYSKLFELAPETKDMFPKEMVEQGKKLVQVLNTIVVSLEYFDDLVDDIKDLGYRHTHFYGVTPNLYPHVKEALVFAIQASLKEKCSPLLIESWGSLYDKISLIMINAENEQHSTT